MSDLVQKLQNVLDRYTASGEECGCQLTVFRHGKLLCDLSSGWTDPTHSRKVTPTTLFPIFSVGNAFATTLIHRLAEQGKLSYDDPVVKFWPEYAAAGKAATTVRNVLSHRAGLFNVPKQLAFEEWFDWSKIVPALAAAADRIGGSHHYHAHTCGVLTGHLAEPAAGRPFRTLLREQILDPLKIDTLFFGLPDDRYAALAPIDGSFFSDSRVDFNRHAV